MYSNFLDRPLFWSVLTDYYSFLFPFLKGFSNHFTWEQARDYCEQKGSQYRFAGFETMDEYLAVKDAIMDQYRVDLWVAARWENAPFDYQWLYGGLPIEDSMWRSGVAPPGATSNCIYLDSDDAALWVAQPNEKRGFLCEYSEIY